MSKFERKSKGLTPRQRLLVVTEGDVTEPKYLAALKHHFRNSLVALKIAGEHGVPMTLVDAAIVLKDQNVRDSKHSLDLRYDAVWVVCDVDEHPNLNEALHKAQSNEIAVALSDPCIELWFLLYKEQQMKHIHRHDAQRKAKELFPGMKGKEWPFKHHNDTDYYCAVRRAQELERRASRTDQRNPSTTLYHLTEAIRAPTGNVPPPPSFAEQAGNRKHSNHKKSKRSAG